MCPHRAQVREELELESQAEQGILGSCGRGGVVPLRPAHGAEQHGIRRAAGVQRRGRQRRTGLVDGLATDRLLVPRHAEAEALAGRIGAATRDATHLWADAVAGQVGDAVLPHAPLPVLTMAACRARAAARASAATGWTAISLLTAAR